MQDTLAKMLALMDAVGSAEREKRPLTDEERKLLPSQSQTGTISEK